MITTTTTTTTRALSVERTLTLAGVARLGVTALEAFPSPLPPPDLRLESMPAEAENKPAVALGQVRLGVVGFGLGFGSSKKQEARAGTSDYIKQTASA